MRYFQKLKSVDFYKKLPTDLTEATITGAWISICASTLMVFLFIMELHSFLTPQLATQLIVDRSPQNQLLRINFNISFPALSCEFATLDVSDTLGTKRLNITKTLTKAPINAALQRLGAATNDVDAPLPKYDEKGLFGEEAINITEPLSAANFDATLEHYPIVVVNFFAPWCHWCQRLSPSWEAATQEVHDKYPEADGRIRFAKVDCTKEVSICREHFIQAFPSIRVFRQGHDDLIVGRFHQHETYQGDRTKESLVSFADALVPSAGQPHHGHQHLSLAPKSAGCNLAGFVLVKRVPGTLHFAARSAAHSFDNERMNMTHVIHVFNMGERPTPAKYSQLKKLHPAGLQPDWADKLRGRVLVSDNTLSTHEHYLQVVLTTIEPQPGHRSSAYDAYEYTAHSHTFVSSTVPSVRFTYDLSPIQILVNAVRKPWYQFLTTTCAIIGGVFTVAGILDATLYQSLSLMNKVNLGKNS